MRMAPDFEKANEIYFRLGIIYKQQQKFNQSLEVDLIGLLEIGCHAHHLRESLFRMVQRTIAIIQDRMAPDFEKANEIYFRLGIIYKQQQKFNQSLEVCEPQPSRPIPRDFTYLQTLVKLLLLLVYDSQAEVDANEIYFRLGIIYKQQQKFNQSLEVCEISWYGS
jgi:tetratricopeptide (TPR) repeat protein